MLDREDIIAIARGATGAVRQALREVETRLGLLERQASAGIKSIVIRNHDRDRRSFVQIMTLADGRSIESEFKMIGIPQYCGVYQVGKRHEMGDMVTHDGSMWVALKDTAESPGKSADWRLAVKRGQDGKDR